MNDNSTLIRSCPRCQTEVKLFTLPEGTMTDPAPAKARPFMVKPCPNCGRKVLIWTGFRQVVK